MPFDVTKSDHAVNIANVFMACGYPRQLCKREQEFVQSVAVMD